MELEHKLKYRKIIIKNYINIEKIIKQLQVKSEI